MKVAEIQLTDDSKIVFSAEEINGRLIASIRVFLESENYKGPTTKGVAVNPEVLEQLVKVAKDVDLSKLKGVKSEKVFAKVKINNFKSVVFHFSRFKGKSRLDLREYYTSTSYTGFGKKGVGVPIEKASEFITNLDELLKVIEAKKSEMPQQGTLISYKDVEPKDKQLHEERGVDTKEVAETEEELLEKPHANVKRVAEKTKGSKGEESKFSRLFTYFYEIFKHRSTVADSTNLFNSVDYFDLSEILENEVLFSGQKAEITFELPDEKLLEKLKKKPATNKKEKEDPKLEAAKLQLMAFNKVKQMFLTYQEKSYEVELYVGFPLLTFESSMEEEKKLFGPLFIAKAEIAYDSSKNQFKLFLISDNFQLNLGLAGKITSDLGKEFFQEKLLESKPSIPLEEKSYRSFLKLIRNLLDFQVGKLPDSLDLNRKPLNELFKEKDKYIVSNKNVLFLARRGDFYILDDLRKLSELDEEVDETILSKLFSYDTYTPDSDRSEGDTSTTIEYLFPFASNVDQRRIAEYSSSPLVLVEGPPGTGKSHSISNLICHLVASGKKVLVTSQKNKALGVVDQNYLDRTGVEYLQMTLLKNDTKAKKLLIEKINELDYYLREKNRWTTESEIDKLKEKYQATEKEINDYKVLFQRTLGTEEENTELYKKYSQIRQFNLITDNLSTLEKKDLTDIKKKLLWMISLYEQSLGQEKEIIHFINLSKCKAHQLKEVVSLLESWKGLITKKKEFQKQRGLRYIEKYFSNLPLSGTRLNVLLLASQQLVEYAQGYEDATKNLKGVPESKIIELAKNVVNGDFAKQDAILDNLKHFIPLLKENQEFSETLRSDTPLSTLEKMKRMIEDINTSSKFYYSFGIFKRFLISRYKEFIRNGEIVRSLHPEEIGELEKAVDYWVAFKMLKQYSKSFILPELINNLTRNNNWTVSEELERIENLLTAIRAKWHIDESIRLKFGVAKDDYEVLYKRFNSCVGMATTFDSLFNLKKIDYELNVINTKLKDTLKNFWPEVNNTFSISHSRYSPKHEQLFKKAYPYLLAKGLEKEFQQFKSTIENLKESIRANGKHHKLFAENIDTVFECEFLDNKIKDLEKTFPLSTQDISERIEVLKKKKTEIISKRIQASIDLNLTKNYLQNSKVQRELAFFRKQLRRSKKSYATFEEMKKEFDFSSLLNIFPCWIMGIDDVSRIFPLVSGLFDYVIFDESSQCNLASSIPALYRGRKAIVVGDEKQLSDFTRMWIPPKFNDLLIKDLRLKEIPKFDALDARYNSLFDSCSVFADRRTLLTEHFRSLPEIINFSNERFYNHKLRIMTNSLNNNLGSILNIIKVDGAIENDLGINEVEAESIVNKLREIVMDPRYNQKTIGVLSPFREQANFIHKLIFDDELLRTKIDEHQLISDTVDGFQGDERDVILYSFRYAPNSSPGIFTFMRTEDGWRRVNVAFTRPRKQVFCFISRDIEEFPAGFVKEFLQYAESGHLEEKTIEGEFDSDFERDVYKVLTTYKDLKVIPQFKTCGFRIDFVLIRDGSALALECDGMFHYDEREELVEEDIERQDILERAGWTIKRLTSREFYRDPENSLAKILGSHFGNI